MKHNLAIIGMGYWGPNVIRAFYHIDQVQICWICDNNPEAFTKISEKYPEIATTTDIVKVLEDPEVNAVVITTPVATHYALAKQALLAGKHVFIEKPITRSVAEAQELLELSKQHEKVVMVGHVFEYNPIIHKLKEYIDRGDLGEIYYLHFERTNLGPIRTDVNALWDLGSHDISIMCYLLGQTPVDVTARGQCFLNKGLEDTVFATFSFANQAMAHVYVSWLNPRKVRKITVVGSDKMAIADDVDIQCPIRLYDKKIEEHQDLDNFLAYKTLVVDKGMYVPAVEIFPPLDRECEHFIHCINHNTIPQSDVVSGLRVVNVLETADLSMKNDSRTMKVPPLRSFDNVTLP